MMYPVRSLFRCGAIIGCMCLGLWTVSVPACAQASQPRTAKSNSAQQGKTAPHKAAPDANATLPASGKPFPDFRLPDAEGQTRSLAELKGKPVALFFFCGCERCQRCALTWGQLQQGGALTATASPSANGERGPANTVIVFMGDSEAA